MVHYHGIRIRPILDGENRPGGLVERRKHHEPSWEWPNIEYTRGRSMSEEHLYTPAHGDEMASSIFAAEPAEANPNPKSLPLKRASWNANFFAY